MLRLSNLADYAVVACTALARSGGRLSAAELAQATQVPAPTMAKLTGALTRSGLLTSTRGAAGGVMLARAAADVSMLDIIEAVDGPIGLVACTHSGSEPCALSDSCQVKPHWPVINETVRGALARATLADMLGAPGNAEARKTDHMATPTSGPTSAELSASSSASNSSARPAPPPHAEGIR
ncbi:MAG: SUF system Fe-S cluster assembly regulator [Pacificimonas sp.]|jgi:FeS assembly SUF system regulator|nr:SUF system Fe-S cluster assembly regulator [Pacificimonas sp.]